MSDDGKKRYWKNNLQILTVMLSIWFIVSFACSILLVDFLDQFRIPGTGFKLGFWFAQQGSILVFVVLIYVYAQRMNRLDHEFDVDEH